MVLRVESFNPQVPPRDVARFSDGNAQVLKYVCEKSH